MGRKPDLEVRQRILEQAEHQIHLFGYRGTAMDDIAKCCRMTKANLFHHYGSKEDLALAVLEAKMADYRQRRVEPLCAQGDPISAVTRMFDDAAEFFDGNGCKAGCFIGNIALEMSDVSEQFRRRVSEFFSEWAGGMAQCLSKAKAKGLFKSSLDPRSAAEALLALYQGAVMLARAQRDAAVFKRVGDIARSLLEQHKK